MNDIVPTTAAPPLAEISSNPLLNVQYFTQVMAIAEVMASSSLLPKTLLEEGKGNNKKDVPYETVKANCFLIANQALKWKGDPFSVAQACSVVHGRLMFEGKLVSAILEANLGVKLGYAFGKWDAGKEECILGEAGSNDLLAIRVYEENEDGSPGRRFVDGYVGGWKTSGDGSPWRPGAYRRQLGYRGAREWARRYEPGIMLGIVTDDEVDFANMRDVTPAPSTDGGNVMDRIKAKQTESRGGFDNGRVQGETGQTTSEPTKASQNKPTDEGQPLKTQTKGGQADLLGGAAANNAGGDPNALTEYDSKWLLNAARMMVPLAKEGTALETIKNQRKAVNDTYPADNVAQRAKDKMKAIIDRCFDIAESKMEEADGIELIAGIVGVEPKELMKQAEKI